MTILAIELPVNEEFWHRFTQAVHWYAQDCALTNLLKVFSETL